MRRPAPPRTSAVDVLRTRPVTLTPAGPPEAGAAPPPRHRHARPRRLTFASLGRSVARLGRPVLLLARPLRRPVALTGSALVAVALVVAVVAAAGMTPLGGGALAARSSRPFDGGRSLHATVSRSMALRPALPTLQVAPLRHLYTPDVYVRTPRPVTAGQLRALSRYGVVAATVVDAGVIRTTAGTLRALGVNPSQFRAFTPRLTAASDPLWRSVARDEMTVSFSRETPLRPYFGQTLLARGSRYALQRVGAFASIGVDGVDALVSHPAAVALGLDLGRGVIVAAPQRTIEALRYDLSLVFGSRAVLQTLRPVPFNQALISSYASSTIPAYYLGLYRDAAATCPGLPWTVLAAIGAVESNHGANTGVSSAGAMGPMQFLPSTFAAFGVDANGDGTANINDPVDAVYSAARYLCLNGGGLGGQSLYDAIFAYNHADWYVREVIAVANEYV